MTRMTMPTKDNASEIYSTHHVGIADVSNAEITLAFCDNMKRKFVDDYLCHKTGGVYELKSRMQFTPEDMNKCGDFSAAIFTYPTTHVLCGHLFTDQPASTRHFRLEHTVGSKGNVEFKIRLNIENDVMLSSFTKLYLEERAQLDAFKPEDYGTLVVCKDGTFYLSFPANLSESISPKNQPKRPEHFITYAQDCFYFHYFPLPEEVAFLQGYRIGEELHSVYTTNRYENSPFGPRQILQFRHNTPRRQSRDHHEPRDKVTLIRIDRLGITEQPMYVFACKAQFTSYLIPNTPTPTQAMVNSEGIFTIYLPPLPPVSATTQNPEMTSAFRAFQQQAFNMFIPSSNIPGQVQTQILADPQQLAHTVAILNATILHSRQAVPNRPELEFKLTNDGLLEVVRVHREKIA